MNWLMYRRRMSFLAESKEPPVSRLPEGYTELDWIASSGTQYISVGIGPLGTWEFSAQATTSGSGSQLLINKGGAGAGNWFGAINYYYKWGAGTASGTYTNIASTTKAKCSITFSSSSVSGTVNEETFTRSRTDNGTNYFLFGYNSSYCISAKLWEITLTSESNVIEFHGVPCRDPNNIVGLYDLVGERFLGNSGTGVFIGSDE